MAQSNTIIAEDDHVIFKRDSTSRVFQIKRNRQAYFEKVKFTVDELIGEFFGTTFEVDKGKLVKLQQAKTLEVEQISAEPGTDNRNLLDSESNQKMTLEDIRKMKSDGLSGEKIIEELIENSETFGTKTSFSQAKYLKKKKKKHLQIFTVLRPTPRLVMEIFAKEPSKICYLRPDTVSQILSYSNVMSGSNVGVVETCQGLLLACFMERIGGDGKVFHIVPNTSDTLCRQVMNYLNFTKDQLNNFYSVPITSLKIAAPGDCRTQTVATADATSAELLENPEDIIGSESHTSKGITVESPDIEAMEAISVTPEEAGDKGEEKIDKQLKRKERLQRQETALQLINNKCLDSLIIACKYNPIPLLMKLVHCLPPSRCVVVYCQYLEPLVQCYSQIKEKQLGCQLKLSETWLRDYQVLPKQTHPVINMSGTGGYLLTFTTVSSNS